MIPSSYFRKFRSFILHNFRFISVLFRRLITGNFRHSYCIISVSFPDYSVIHIPSFPRIIPSFVFHHFRFISGVFRRSYFIISASFSGLFRHSYFSISVSFPEYSVFHLFRLISGLFRRSYFIISVSFPDYSVVHISSFPHYSVVHIPSFPLHFRIIPSSSVRVFFDLGLFSLETETQQYVLLGINYSKCRHDAFLFLFEGEVGGRGRGGGSTPGDPPKLGSAPSNHEGQRGLPTGRSEG